MDRIEVLPVADSRALREFIRLPWTIYRSDPFWIPPLLADMRKLLDKSRHPFFRHSSADLFLARRRGEWVGRIAAILNNNHNRFHQESTAFFGFFESVNDKEVAAELLDRTAQWARDRGMAVLRGPMNYSTNETLGLLIEGFSSSPCIMMSHNPVYYPALVESAGFDKAMDLFAWRLTADQGLPPKIARVSGRVLRDEGIQVRTIDMRRFWEEVQIIQKIYNDAWSDNWGFVPMTDTEFHHMAKELKTIVDPRIILIAEKNGDPVAFSLALPDINQALKHVNGRLFPLGFPLLMYHARRIRQLRVLALGVVKKLRDWSGLGAALYFETFHRGLEAGYRSGEFSWTLETNDLINRSMKLLGAQIYKRYRIYQRRL